MVFSPVYERFQSLFCWKLFCNGAIFAQNGGPSRIVSILVLLEAVLQLGSGKRR